MKITTKTISKAIVRFLALAAGMTSATAAVVYDSNIYSYAVGTPVVLATDGGVTVLTFTGIDTAGLQSIVTMPKIGGASTSAVFSTTGADNFRYVAPVADGVEVSTSLSAPDSGFSSTTDDLAYLMTSESNGGFYNATKYIAFYFDNNNVHNYGWALVAGLDSTQGSIIGWAYEDTGSPISVGAVPEPSTYALCGIGAFALIGHRRRRTA
jgi:hypothetical protein